MTDHDKLDILKRKSITTKTITQLEEHFISRIKSGEKFEGWRIKEARTVNGKNYKERLIFDADIETALTIPLGETPLIEIHQYNEGKSVYLELQLTNETLAKIEEFIGYKQETYKWKLLDGNIYDRKVHNAKLTVKKYDVSGKIRKTVIVNTGVNNEKS